MGQSAEGDLYAGHNGNVYKKTDDGWQSYDPDSGWSDVQRPENPQGQGRAEAAQGARPSGTQPMQQPAGGQTREAASQRYSSASMYGPSEYSRNSAGGAQSINRDFSQLDRDASARRSGTSNFQRTRSGGFSGSRGGGGRRRR